MLRSTVFVSAIGAASVLALSCFPASADEAADVQALKQEVAALQKKLNVLEKQEQVDRAQQQAAIQSIQSWETTTSGKDGKDSKDPWKFFGVKFTFGGFVSLDGIFRNKDEVTSIGTAFQKIPFDNFDQAHVNEWRATAQHSRFSMLAEANVSDYQKYASYLEFDFLGAAPTANSNESNSYTPRLRQFYATGDDNPDGWHFLAGQSWSLVTMFKEGLIARKENIPNVPDAQYVPGFNWLRAPEIRIVKDWDKQVWLGIEAATPQALFGGNLGGIGGLPANAAGAPLPSNKNVITSFPCNSQLNNAVLNNFAPQGCTLDFMPDITAKLAFDPGWGHYEIFGLARGFRDRVDVLAPGAGALPVPGETQQNNQAFGFSGGGGVILPVWGDKLQLQANVLYGSGIGRYDAAQLPDVTVNPDGTLTPLMGYSIMGGITSHNAIKDVDLYVYAGENHVFNHVTFVAPNKGFGFGDGTIDNTNCTTGLITNSTSTCAGQINDVWQVTGGFWWNLYDGDKGRVVWGVQDSFTVDKTPTPGIGFAGTTACAGPVVPGTGGLHSCGAKESADMNTVLLTFRYYPKYGQLIGMKP
jgi:hypothetical protein